MSVIMKPMAEALKPLQEELRNDVQLSIDANRGAYTLCAADMDTFTRDVHEYFYSTYYVEHKDRLNYILSRVSERLDEVLLSTLAGKLRRKLPPVRVPRHPGDEREAQARQKIAMIICHCLMDANTFPHKIQHKVNAEGKWETLTYLYLGGEPVRDLMAGLHFKPGVATQTRVEGWQLPSKFKKKLKRLSSMPFVLSDIYSYELCMFLYSLKDDWNKRVDKEGRKLREDHNTKVARYSEYATLIEALEDNVFYLEPKYSGSGRMFYRFQLEGLRPQGKLHETLFIDSAVAYHLEDNQLDALKHMIYCTLTGERVTPEEASLRWTEDMLHQALDSDVYSCTTEEEAGECLLLLKAARALKQSEAGEPTNYIFGWDFTNSGLIMAGLSFHSEEMMNAGNIHNRDDVVDAHTEFGDAFNLGVPRKAVKKIHMPLLHGASLHGITKAVNAVSEDTLTKSEVMKKMEDAYGPCVRNLIDIADWGVNILHNEQTKFQWTLPDGFRATHKAYFESVTLHVTVASADPKHERSHRTTHKIVCDLPYAKDNTGQPLHKVPGRAPKVRGLYANITHSLDSYVLREVVDPLLDTGVSFLMKHDDYIVHPAFYQTVKSESKQVFNKLFETNLYEKAMQEIAFFAKSKPPVPGLVRGNAENVIEDAEAYLMP